MIKRALISVSDKNGIVDFAQQLSAANIQLLSTGGTAALLREQNIPVTDVSEVTGFPEIMGGRVKTLHPKVHGAILARRGTDEAVMQEHGIDAIDLVVINLYPFEQTIADPDCSFSQAIENIDIGGPAMVRAAAKNHAAVTIVTDPSDYSRVLDDLGNGSISSELRFDLAVKAFEHTAKYDGLIASYLGSCTSNAQGELQHTANFSRTLNLQLEKVIDLRYGENPHQTAAFYRESNIGTGNVADAIQLQGKELSYNNIADTDAALECVKQFAQPACVIVKHANPCGVAESDSTLDAYEKAFQTDPTSAFGGIIAFNRPLDRETCEAIVDRQFVEVIIAPKVSAEARACAAAKPNIRLLECGALAGADNGLHYARVVGGLLVQERDNQLFQNEGANADNPWQVVTQNQPDPQQQIDLEFAWKVARFVKSNAIVFCRNQQTLGVGAGQMSRVYSSRIAAIKAADENLDIRGAVMASDAFFPFRDGIDAAAAAGITAVIQPGGSVKDEEVIAAANEHGMTMVLTGIRHFRH